MGEWSIRYGAYGWKVHFARQVGGLPNTVFLGSKRDSRNMKGGGILEIYESRIFVNL